MESCPSKNVYPALTPPATVQGFATCFCKDSSPDSWTFFDQAAANERGNGVAEEGCERIDDAAGTGNAHTDEEATASVRAVEEESANGSSDVGQGGERVIDGDENTARETVFAEATENALLAESQH